MNRYVITCGVFLILSVINTYKFGYDRALLDLAEKSLERSSALKNLEDYEIFLESMKCSDLALDMLN